MAANSLVTGSTQRKLRTFALDPSLAAQFGMESSAELTIRVPWEPDLRAGPVGEFIELVDVDPTSSALYKPVLNDPQILWQDSLAPSETSPQFHQQMAYAVAMLSVVHFEQALGVRALWASHRESNKDGSFKSEHFSISSGACGSTPTRCATGTPTTARRRRRYRSGTFRRV